MIHDQNSFRDAGESAAEAALAESRRQLATLIGNLPGIVYRCGTAPPWALDFVSDGVLAITGHPAAEWMAGRISWADIVHADDLPRLSDEIEAAVAARRPFCATYRIRHREGEWRWLMERGQPVAGADGTLFLEGFIADVTEQKQLEASLQREAQRVSASVTAVLENTLDRVYSLDSALRFTYVNARFRQQHAEEPELIGRSIADLLPGFEDTDFGRAYRRVIDTRVAETIEAHYPPVDRWFEAHVTPTEGGVTVFYRDVTERKQAEKALRDSTARARSILDSVPQIVFSTDARGQLDYLSPQWQALTGRDNNADLGTGWMKAVHGQDRRKVRAAWARSIAGGRLLDVEMRLRDAEGSFRWVLLRASPRRAESGEIERWFGTCTDVNERVVAQAALEESEAITRSILDASPDCIKLLDADGRILFVNPLGPAAVDLDDKMQLIGRRWVNFLLPETAQIAADALDRARGGETVNFTMPHPTHKGRPKWWDIVVTPVKGAEGARIVVVARDVTHQKQSEEQVRWAANHDPLTGLPNRLLFQERLDQLVTRDERLDRFALLLLDLDDFKRVNDSLGHDAGDILLCAFAERLRAAVRAEDFVARLGGDEFAVIVSGAQGEEQVTSVADSILSELRRPHIHAGRVLDCNASIGASLFPKDGRSRAELLKHADIALYVAKSSWRGNLRLFQPAMRADMQNRVSMLALARNALEKDLIIPFYQPKVDLRSGRVAGFEALLRWRDPRRGIQAPNTIAAAFEDINTAAEISDRMIAKVVADMKAWTAAGVDFGHVAINAAAAEFRKGGFAEALLAQLDAAGVGADKVQVEITETVFLGRGADCVERALKTLSEAGVRIALDDFGTGYASLSHLKQFPVDVLKIDRSFVAELGENDDAAAIVRAVINLGRSLEIEVVAEGIETEAQASWLTEGGCHLGQGHLYAPASAAAEVKRLLARLNAARHAA
ncbi:EAL domain-containing protein [Sphingomonas parva]|uniref:EAL domain-containing protein n=1 Tax=Sphingomonas parva TaxID=2555898 RepID=A0A4Y8ZP32_9SPHN|nr:EAL domain-containing protein [Sphingomonas parva]TFI57771.1 EAL domain-containing protein [Sphingomonas parva]